jgi:excisionase family DNA binding protein|tara:strand:- start:316 stop:513 length:198 start_codon:yes stop_codon:yes gene_type:complete
MEKTLEPQELFYTVKEVAKILKTTPKTVRSYITLNQLYAHRLPNNGGYRVHLEELNRFIDGLRLG